MEKLILNRTTVLVTTLLIFITFESNAQVALGIRAGYNLSKLDYLTHGFHIGPTLRTDSGKVRVSIDLLLSTKGASSNSYRIYNFTYVPVCLDLPVLFHYKPIKWLYIGAGIQPSFTLTSYKTTTSPSANFSNSFVKPTDAYFSRFDLAPVIALGVESKRISLEIRGTHSLFKISAGSYNTRNVTLMLSVGYRLSKLR